MHVRALFDAVAWVQAGAQGSVEAPKRKAAEAETERLHKRELEAKVQTEFEQRVEAEVAKRTADLVPELQAAAAHEAALHAVTTGVPRPGVAPVEALPEPLPPAKPLAPELQALGAQLELLNGQAFQRLSEVALLEQLERVDEAADSTDDMVQCMVDAGIELEALGGLLASVKHLLQTAQAQQEQTGDIKALQRQLSCQGFTRHQLRALAETTLGRVG